MDVSKLIKGSIALMTKIVNLFIHSFGLYLLHCLSRKNNENVQIIYITSLSATELIVNIFSLSRNFLRLIPSFDNLRSSRTFKEIVMYSYILDYQLKFCLYMWMLYITIDRVCGVLLNFRYSNFWSPAKAKLLVGLTWLLAFSVLIYMATIYTLKRLDKNHIHTDELFQIANYVVMVFDLSFVVIAALSYFFIFYRYQRSRLNRFLWKAESESTSVWRVFRHSRFYVSVLLISTYIVFTILPDLLWTFGVVSKYNIQFLMTIMYASSHLADAIIYIFMDNRVKKMLSKKLKKIPYFRKRLIASKNKIRIFSESSETGLLSQWKHKKGDNCYSRNFSDTTPLSSASSSFKDRRETYANDKNNTFGFAGGLVPPSFSKHPTKSPVVNGITANLETIFVSLTYQQPAQETAL